MKIHILPFLSRGSLAAFVAVAVLGGPAVAAQAPLDLTVEQAPIAAIGEDAEAPASRDYKVTAWVDRRDATYSPGDVVTLRVRSNRDAYITVLDVGTSGRATVIFPNAFQRDNRVRAYDVVQIPGEGDQFRIRVSGPTGREVLKVFASDKPIEYFDAARLAASGPYYSVQGDTRSIARDLNVELRDRRSNYGVATQLLRIVDGRREGYQQSYNSNGEGRFEDTVNRTPEENFQYAEATFYGENRGGSLRDAVRYYMRAAEGGHVAAMVRLGQLLEKGVGQAPDLEGAISWYRRAAELGSPPAMVQIARMYYEGRGLRRDFGEALRWLTKAAQAGDGIAMARLARAYDEGRGMTADPRRAAEFALAAVKAGAWSVQNDMPQFTAETRQEMQRILKEAGFYRGAIDGDVGVETKAAIAEYTRTA